MSTGEIFSFGGTVVGTYFGGPLGGAVGGAIGGLLGNLIDPVQLDDIEGRRVEGDIELTGVGVGNPIPWVWGTGPVTLKINWSTGLTETVVEETEGGKGAPEQTTRTFTYAATFGGTLCKGEVILRKIWREGDLIYDMTDNAGPIYNTDFITGPEAFRFYPGSADQLPDPDEQADKGVAATPAYRNIARLVMIDHDVTDLVRIPTIRCEVATATGTATYPETDVTTANVFQAEFMAMFLPDGITLWAGLNQDTLTEFDAASQTEIRTKTLAEAGSLAVGYRGGDFDLQGNYYGGVIENVLANNGSVVKYDALTLDVTGKTELTSQSPDNGSIADGPIVVRRIGFTLQTQRIVAASGAAKAYVINPEPKESIVTLEDFPLLRIERTIDLDALLGGSHLIRDITVDANGDLWILAKDQDPVPDTVTLARLSGSFGQYEDAVTGIAIAALGSNSALAYEETTHALLILATDAGGDQLYRWDIATETLSSPLAVTAVNDEHWAAMRQGPLDGILWLPESFNVTEIDVVNGGGSAAPVKLRTLADSLWPGGNSTGGLLDRVNHAFIKAAGTGGSATAEWRFLDRTGAGAVTLDTVFSEVCTSQEVGFAAGDITVTELAAEPVEFAIAESRQAARRFLEALARPHFVRARPKDWGVEFILRGQTASFALTADDLGATAGEPIERIRETFKDPLELPQRLDVEYTDRDSDYEPEIQPATRAPEAVVSRRTDSIDYPGVLTADKARQIAEVALHTAYVAADEAEVTVTWEHIRIDPGDVGTVTEGGVTRTMEVQETELGADMAYRLKLKGEDDETFVSTASGRAPTVGKDVISIGGPTQLFVLDIPAPSDDAGDQLARFIMAGPSGTGTWRGTMVEQSDDGESGWAVVEKIPKADGIAWGYLRSALAVGPTTTFDRDNTLSVQLVTGTLSSATEAQLLADDELNPFFLLGDQGWELGQYGTVTALGNNRYDLTLLRRGRRNTENYMTGHTAGVPVIFPPRRAVKVMPFGAAEIDITTPKKTYFRAVDANGVARTVIEHTIVGRSQRHYSPTKIQGTVAADVWTITWDYRSRLGGSLTFSATPIPGAIHDYEVDVLDAPGGTVKRTITSTASGNGSVVTVNATGGQAVYDDDDQIADFGSVQTTIHIEVYQMSDLVLDGSGNPAFRGEPKAVTLIA